MSVHTDDIVVDSLPLPPNAAQETGGHLASIDTKLTNPLPISGTVSTTQLSSSTSTVTAVVVPANTDTVLLAANANRKKAIIFIPAKGFVKFGIGASASSFTYNATTNSFTLEVTVWTGTINIFSAGQTVLVTELT